ncbi:MAG: hypothetical protein IPG71_01520 [bacterium]|nr:hypothetical protein [bacterium]
MRDIIVSTLAFIPLSILLHRRLDDWGLDPGASRTLLVAVMAGALSYAVAFIVELLLA